MTPQNWEQAFEDWERLLRIANAVQLLDDPKAIWDEAWRQASMHALALVGQEAPPAIALDLHDKLERKLLK